MKKLWLIVATTYKRRVRSGSFLVMTLGLPLLMLIGSVLPILGEFRSALPAVGYVDQTGQLSEVGTVEVGDETLALTSYADVAAARQAVAEDAIAGFLVVPEGYLQGDPDAQPVYYSNQAPKVRLETALARFLQQGLVSGTPDWKQARLLEDAQVTYVSAKTGDAIRSQAGMIVRVAVPVVLGVLFSLVVFATLGELGTAVVQEKEQRSMEMILTSLRPRELVAGKVLGMSLLSLTQVAVWALGGALAAALAFSSGLDLAGIRLPWRPLVWAALLGVPGYLLYAVLAAALGIVAGNRTDARQLAARLGFVALAPLWFVVLLIRQPDGALAVGLTLFPLTAPIIATFRMVLTEVPTWQLAAGWGALVLSLGLALWVLGRLFHTTVLLYGQTLSPRQIWQALGQASDTV